MKKIKSFKEYIYIYTHTQRETTWIEKLSPTFLHCCMTNGKTVKAYFILKLVNICGESSSSSVQTHFPLYSHLFDWICSAREINIHIERHRRLAVILSHRSRIIPKVTWQKRSITRYSTWRSHPGLLFDHISFTFCSCSHQFGSTKRLACGCNPASFNDSESFSGPYTTLGKLETRL